MAKKKMTGKLPIGTRIRVKSGSTAPEFPDVSIAGWTGTITEARKQKSTMLYMIEWDDSTIENMPPSYLQQCEEKMLYHKMACLDGELIEAEQ